MIAIAATVLQITRNVKPWYSFFLVPLVDFVLYHEQLHLMFYVILCLQQNKENVEPPPLLSALSSSSSSFIMKKMEATPTRKTTHTAPTLASSPSLFEILKGQNTRNHDAHSPHAWMQQKTSQISPIFSAFRPTKAAAANRLVSK